MDAEVVNVPFPIRSLGPADAYLARARARVGALWLHCGCGRNLVRNWVNCDVITYVDPAGTRTLAGEAWAMRNRVVYVKLDALLRYPLDDGTVARAYSEHLIEHLSLKGGVAWLTEIHRVLAPGGLLRISTPDLERFVRAYLDPEQALFSHQHAEFLARGSSANLPRRRAFLFNTLFRHWGHRWIHDFEELAWALSQAGFKGDRIERRAFREGAIPAVAEIDQEWRRPESLYVEAVKS